MATVTQEQERHTPPEGPMTSPADGRVPRRWVQYLIGLVLVGMVAVTAGSAGAALVVTGQTPLTWQQVGPPGPAGATGPRGLPGAAAGASTRLAPQLECWIAGVDDAGLQQYGLVPISEPSCPSGRAVDLALLRAAWGHP